MSINVFIPYLKECNWSLFLCMIFARSLLMLHVISCCTTPVTRLSLLHLPRGNFAPAWPWFCWIVGPPLVCPWSISWVECGFFHNVTTSLFHGGLWVLHRHDHNLFLCTFLVEFGSFNTAKKHVPWWYLERSLSNMTIICFLGWNGSPSLAWLWSVSLWNVGPSPT